MSPSTQALCVQHLSEDLSGVALADVPLPPVGPNDVRVQVRAAGLNFPDLLMTRGAYQLKPSLPFVCGIEGAGVVLEVGTQVQGWRVGDEVCFNQRGTLARQVVVQADAMRSLPVSLSMQEAACAHVTALTAWVALARRARLQQGEWLMVNGARGGVGWACLQLGQYLGARLIATASDPARLGYWRDQGVPVLKADANLPKEVKALTNGQGVDVVADPVGGALFDHSLRCMAWEGRFLVLGFAAGSIPTLSINRALIKGLSVLGVRAGETGRRNPQAGAENHAAVERLLAQGVMRPRIGLTVPLAQGQEALRAMAAGSVVGKIVVTMD